MNKKNLNIFLLIIPLCIIVSCQSKNESKCELQYDFEVKRFEEVETTEINRNKFKEDILYVAIGGIFKGESLTIYKNNEFYKELINLETDPSSGLTDELTLNRNDLNNVAFRINNSNLILVDFCNNSTNFMTFHFIENKVLITLRNSPPKFD
jgi:hypothetical protein